MYEQQLCCLLAQCQCCAKVFPNVMALSGHRTLVLVVQGGAVVAGQLVVVVVGGQQ